MLAAISTPSQYPGHLSLLPLPLGMTLLQLSKMFLCFSLAAIEAQVFVNKGTKIGAMDLHIRETADTRSMDMGNACILIYFKM